MQHSATPLSDHWKVVFEFYIKWCENGCSSSILLRCASACYPTTERLKYSNCTVNPSKYGKGYTSIITIKYVKFITLVGNRAIINTRDPMQNPGQTRIFYKPGQTHLTRTKRDPVDPAHPSQFQPWFVYFAWFVIPVSLVSEIGAFTCFGGSPLLCVPPSSFMDIIHIKAAGIYIQAFPFFT